MTDQDISTDVLLALALSAVGGEVFVSYELLDSLELEGKAIGLTEDTQRDGYVIALIDEDEVGPVN